MRSVGIRQLRQSASELLRHVEAGETIEITDRGRPVAVLAPIDSGKPLERLRRTGELSQAAGELEDLPEPLPLAQGQEAPSAVLAGLRRDER